MEMLIPGMMAVFMPVAIGFLLTSKGLAGMLVGALSSGFMLAVTMSNAGGAWDNAKKYVEKSGKKGTEHHDATVVGDTVGDPFKDTSGPALNILIKLMSVISLVIAPKLKALQLCPKTGKLAFETSCTPGQILAWEPTGVIIGAVILLLLMLFSYCWQKKIDTDYAQKRDALNKLKEEYAAKNAAKEAAKVEEEAKNAEEDETPSSEAAAGDIEMTEQDSDTKKE
jgi:hypothetical protein